MRWPDEHGFTLVETLVALLLLGVGVLYVAPLFVIATRGAATGAELGAVGAIAVEHLETLRATPYASLAAGGSLTGNVAGYFDDSTAGFLVRWQIATNIATPSTKIITLRAFALRAADGARREVTLVTMRGT